MHRGMMVDAASLVVREGQSVLQQRALFRMIQAQMLQASFVTGILRASFGLAAAEASQLSLGVYSCVLVCALTDVVYVTVSWCLFVSVRGVLVSVRSLSGVR